MKFSKLLFAVLGLTLSISANAACAYKQGIQICASDAASLARITGAPAPVVAKTSTVAVAKPVSGLSGPAASKAYALQPVGSGVSGYANKPGQVASTTVMANNYITQVNAAVAAKNQLYYSQYTQTNASKNCKMVMSYVGGKMVASGCVY